MKAAFLILIVASSALAIPQMVQRASLMGRSPMGGSLAMGGRQMGGRQIGAQPLTPTNPKANFGPRFYGQGLENPYAFPVNPFVANRVKALVAATPGALARVDLDGDITITDQFGQEVDIMDQFGRDVSDLYDI